VQTAERRGARGRRACADRARSLYRPASVAMQATDTRASASARAGAALPCVLHAPPANDPDRLMSPPSPSEPSAGPRSHDPCNRQTAAAACCAAVGLGLRSIGPVRWPSGPAAEVSDPGGRLQPASGAREGSARAARAASRGCSARHSCSTGAACACSAAAASALSAGSPPSAAWPAARRSWRRVRVSAGACGAGAGRIGRQHATKV
jgi:hypothetical protein